jgi:opacity protein-like surface antigen
MKNLVITKKINQNEKNKIQVLLISLVAVLVLSLFFQVHPINAQEKNWYIGVGVGATEVESDVVLWKVLNPSHLEMGERGVGFKVLAGYKINDFFSFELSYNDFDKLEITASSGAMITTEGVVWEFTQDGSNIEVDLSTIALGSVVSFPLKKVTNKSFLSRLAPYGKFGVHYWSVDKSVSGGTINYYQWQNAKPNPSNPTVHNTQDESGFGWFYGVGISCTVNEQFSLILGWEWYSIKEGMIQDSDFIYSSVVYNF